MPNKIKCVVVDDDLFIHNVLDDLCRNHPNVELIEKFDCPKKFLQAAPGLDFDVCILDIMMPEINGIDVAKRLKGKQVIFITGMREQIVDALDLSPTDIVTKPIQEDRFYKALEKAQSLVTKKKAKDNVQSVPKKSKIYDSFNTTGSGRKLLLKLTDICLVTANSDDPRNKNVTMKDGRQHLLMGCTMARLLNANPYLIQVNKSELVSMDSISEFERDTIIIRHTKLMEKGRLKEIHLGRRFRKKFLNRLTPLKSAV